MLGVMEDLSLSLVEISLFRDLSLERENRSVGSDVFRKDFSNISEQ